MSESVNTLDDALLAGAIARAPRHMAAIPPPGRAEAELEKAVRLGLTEMDVPADRVGARRRYIDSGWDPLPGGLDLYLTHPAGNDLCWVAELKYAKVEDTLWDLIKVSCAFSLSQASPLHGAYLIVAAGDTAWRARGNCSELFRAGGDHDILELIENNPGAWCSLLQGGRARPRTVPRHLHVTPLPVVSVPQRGDVAIRAVRVDVVGDDTLGFDPDGWPTAAVTRRDCPPPGAARSPSLALSGATIDCAGYPVPARFSSSLAANNAWLADHVPLMHPPQLDAFEAVLRGRQWKEWELDGRVRMWVSRPLWSDLDALLQAVSVRATNLHSFIHGPTHWHSVALAALHLLGAGERADRPIAFLFALLHDVMRADDGADPEHGPRAATLAAELRHQGLLEMADSRAERLERALSGHTLGTTSSDPTIALCWDADRLDIGRVGLVPDPRYFSTEAGRAIAADRQPLRWANGPPDWQELATLFGL